MGGGKKEETESRREIKEKEKEKWNERIMRGKEEKKNRRDR
jgi:hypothetical protein